MSEAPNRHGWNATFGRGNAFAFAARTGLIAASLPANSTIFAFRNPGPSVMVVIRMCLSANAVVSPAANFTQTLGLFRAYPYTVFDTGGTVIQLEGSENFFKDSGEVYWPATGYAEARIATTGTLTPGTRTLGTMPTTDITFSTPVTPAAPVVILPKTEIVRAFPGDDPPYVLRANDGFVLMNLYAQPAAMTWGLVVEMEYIMLGSF